MPRSMSLSRSLRRAAASCAMRLRGRKTAKQRQSQGFHVTGDDTRTGPFLEEKSAETAASAEPGEGGGQIAGGQRDRIDHQAGKRDTRKQPVRIDMRLGHPSFAVSCHYPPIRNRKPFWREADKSGLTCTCGTLPLVWGRAPFLNIRHRSISEQLSRLGHDCSG